MKRLLLHVCCAPCATAVIEQLIDEYDLTLLFYNPNILPYAEYTRRLNEVKKLAEKLGVPMLEGDHVPGLWFDDIKGHEKDLEGGERCNICYRFRLKEAFRVLKEKEFDFFATTLTISPHINSENINEIGRDISHDKYFESDFKKQGGFERSIELSKWFHLYRQNYCGCIYSLRKN